ncbi:hypothetical protein F383_38707 [Gossypium arboreum]|uniref:Uncharacterized protein n=1 Tax=Gossypium arboreum TaxID=29729 RepID=A0A0B0MLW5_GOSAR|nr:hypothetical protein F383_38707 [Gossypium arboreum]
MCFPGRIQSIKLHTAVWVNGQAV